jgi:hypothetical protein
MTALFQEKFSQIIGLEKNKFFDISKFLLKNSKFWAKNSKIVI